MYFQQVNVSNSWQQVHCALSIAPLNAESFWWWQCSIRHSLPLHPSWVLSKVWSPSLPVPLQRQLDVQQVQPTQQPSKQVTNCTASSSHWQQASIHFLPYSAKGSFRDEGLWYSINIIKDYRMTAIPFWNRCLAKTNVKYLTAPERVSLDSWGW